jgi:protein arginine N-methyltransferase 1
MYDHTAVDNLTFHHSMLFDEVRTSSFLQAILRTVQPGDVVLDIGSGTGILSLFACLAGASHVYAVDEGPVIEIAKRVCQDNGFGDRVTFMQDWSTNIELPARANVLVTETIGNAGFDEGILGWVVDAKKRLLTPDATIIPRALTLMVVPVESKIDYEFLDDWLRDYYSFDYSAIRSLVANSLLQTDLSSKSFVGKPVPLVSIDMESVDPHDDTAIDIQHTANSQAVRDGVIHGIGAWFTAELITGLNLSNIPPNRTPSWSQILFPLERPLRVKSGDNLLIIVKMKANAAEWEWEISTDTDRKQAGPSQQKPIKLEQTSLAGKLISVNGEATEYSSLPFQE